MIAVGGPSGGSGQPEFVQIYYAVQHVLGRPCDDADRLWLPNDFLEKIWPECSWIHPHCDLHLTSVGCDR